MVFLSLLTKLKKCFDQENIIIRGLSGSPYALHADILYEGEKYALFITGDETMLGALEAFKEAKDREMIVTSQERN